MKGGGVASSGGKLELTWSDKENRLLSHGGERYEWVSPADWRVAEVRLLDEGEGFGAAASGNLLIQGDALHALTALGSVPEYSDRYVGKVRLCYIDPPFNTGKAFTHYDDAVSHSVWLTMLRDRLMQIKKLLAPNGSVWVHLDDAEQHRARCVLDEVFGADAFISTIVWENFYGRSNAAAVSPAHNYIHVYSPMGKERWRHERNLLPREGQALSKYSNPDGDPRGPWRSGPIFAPEERHEGLMYEVTTPAGKRVSPPKGSHWRMSEPDFWDLVEDGRILFGADGDGAPAVKLFLSEVQDGLVSRSWWPHQEVGHSQEGKREIQALFPDGPVFDTPKPERLMERIIHIASNPGEIVLDCFGGSGTTAAVAHKMGRKWVTVELSEANLQTFVRPRLERVISGDEPGGVTKAQAWSGGGGFDMAVTGPSMFEDCDGSVVLADWATGGALSEAVAAQLGFRYEPEGPFSGSKGRARLAVIDGMVTAAVADYLIGLLDDKETLVVVAQALEPGVEDHVRAARRGSRARKVPRDLALHGRASGRTVQLTPVQDGEDA